MCAFHVGAEVETERCNVMSFLADFLSNVHVSRWRGTTKVETNGRNAMSFFRANNSLLHIFYPACAFHVGAKVETEGCNATSFLTDFLSSVRVSRR